jgi:hypothetical protein
MEDRKESSLVARDAKICDARLNKNMTVNQIGRLFGLDPRTVEGILDRNLGKENVPRVKSSRRYCDQKPISGLHSQIGHDVGQARAVSKKSVDEFATMVGMSRLRLRKIEIGIEDLTLSELGRLAAACGTTIETLITPRNQHGGHRTAAA